MHNRTGVRAPPRCAAIDYTRTLGVLVMSGLSALSASVGPQDGLSFAYQVGGSAGSAAALRAWDGPTQPVAGPVYVYATFRMGPVNPLRYVDGVPEWRPAGTVTPPAAGEAGDVLGGFVMQEQARRPEGRPQFLETVVLGLKADGGFVPVARFGLADDGRAEDRAQVCPWVSDGTIDYFGPYARPNTPYDFRLRLDLIRKRLTAWVSGRGDDDWFLLAEDVPLTTAAAAVDHLRVEMYPGGPEIEGLKVLPGPYEPAETVRPHPEARKARVVGPDGGFRFQSLRSTWRQPGRHVTIFRQPGVHAGFPDVALAGPHDLVCVWRNGSHTGGTGGLSVAHSHDLGHTWSAPTEVTRLGGNCPRLQRLKDGALLLLVDVPSGGDQFHATWDLVLWDSTDGGKTWTNERWLRTQQVGGGGCIVPSRICETADGSWLLAASYFAKPANGGQYVEILDYYRSTDRGTTWQFLGQPDHYPPFCLSEPSPVQLPDGRLFVVARESRSDGMPGAKGFSRDGGRTWEYRELPHPITGRTCAGLLPDGRTMNTFRSGVGRAALWAWFGFPDDPARAQPEGGHFNDRWSVGLKDGALHLDNDGVCGQFTKYNFKPPLSAKHSVEVTVEVKVVENQGRAATVFVPFAGALRVFADHVAMAHDSALRVAVAPGAFHTYRIEARAGRLRLSVDGDLKLESDKGDSRLSQLPWTEASTTCLAFGNEAAASGFPDVYPRYIPREVTGYSLWRRFEAVLIDPDGQREVQSWVAARDRFPDQYQLDHMMEIEASVSGHDQGYSGWTRLPDGRIFVVHYTDDTAAACRPNPHQFGVPWIRGTFLLPGDVPPVVQ